VLSVCFVRYASRQLSSRLTTPLCAREGIQRHDHEDSNTFVFLPIDFGDGEIVVDSWARSWQLHHYSVCVLSRTCSTPARN
jgi:hypothetical protein